MLSSPSTRPWAVARSLSATDLADRSLPAGLAHLDGGAPAEPWARGSPGRVAPPPPTSVLRLDCGATVPSGVPAEPLARGSSGRARPHVAAEPVTASSPGVAVAWGCMEENVRLRRELASLRGCLAGSRTLQAEDSWSWRDAGGPEGLLEEQAAAPRPSAPEAQEAALRALDELAELVARVHPARLRRDARDYPVLGAGGGARGAASELDAPERCWLEGGGARGQLRGHVAQVLDWAAATVDCGREGYFHLDLRCRSAGAGALVRALGRISSRSSGWALRRLSAAAAASRAARKESSRRRGPELLLQRLRGAAGRAGERRVLELAAACFRRWRERSEDGAAWIRRRSPFVEHRWRSALGRLARQAWTAWAEAWRAAARESLERAWTEELETTRRQLLEEAASQARELEGAVQEFRVRAADADQELEAARREFRASAAAQEQELEVRRELHASAAAQVQELEAARRELRARAATQAHKFIVVSLSGTVRAPFSAWLRAAQEAREKRAACAALAFAPQRWLLEQIVMRWSAAARESRAGRARRGRLARSTRLLAEACRGQAVLLARALREWAAAAGALRRLTESWLGRQSLDLARVLLRWASAAGAARQARAARSRRVQGWEAVAALSLAVVLGAWRSEAVCARALRLRQAEVSRRLGIFEAAGHQRAFLEWRRLSVDLRKMRAVACRLVDSAPGAAGKAVTCRPALLAWRRAVLGRRAGGRAAAQLLRSWDQSARLELARVLLLWARASARRAAALRLGLATVRLAHPPHRLPWSAWRAHARASRSRRLRGSAGRGALRVLLGRASPALLRAAWCAWQGAVSLGRSAAAARGELQLLRARAAGGLHGRKAAALRRLALVCWRAAAAGGGARRRAAQLQAACGAVWLHWRREVRGQRQRRQAAGRLAAALRRAHGAAAGGTLRCWLAGALRGSLQAAAPSSSGASLATEAERAGRGATVGAGARASVLGAVARAIGVRGGGGEPATAWRWLVVACWRGQARKQRARARAGPLVDSALVWACSRLSVYSSRWVLGICFWALRSLSAGGRLQEARAEQARLKAGLASGLRHQRGLEGELEAARAEAQRLRLQSGATKDRLRNLVDLQDRTAAAEPAREESSVITIVTTTGRARGPPGPRALKGL